jgi:sec-independent protein translocase protein TatA
VVVLTARARKCCNATSVRSVLAPENALCNLPVPVLLPFIFMNTLATFGNIFGVDTLMIFFVVVLLFGAKKLPELAKGVGGAIREFSKAKNGADDASPPPPPPAIK